MFLALLSLVVVAPFERRLLDVPGGLTLTTVELVAMAAVGVVALRVKPRARLAHTPLLVPGVVMLIVMALAAVAAPIERGNAVRFVARLGMAAMLFAATFHVVTTRARARIVAATALAVATVVASVAVLEAAEVPAVLSALTAFRPGFHVVGGQLRATSTLIYPTIASMYLEMAFVLGLWLLIDPAGPRVVHGSDGGESRAGRRMATVACFAALVVVAAGITATFTRAGLLAMAVAIVLVGAIRLSRVSVRRARLGTLSALAAMVIVVVAVSHAPELVATRLTTEGSQAWYGASYTVPAMLTAAAGAAQRVPVTVANTGRIAWDSQREPAFALSYHWLRAGSGEVVQFDGVRTPFPRVIGAGDAATFDATVVAPGAPGQYTLVWDVVHETRAWLSTEGVVPARTAVEVRGAAVSAVVTAMKQLPAAAIVPPRPRLWEAAMRMAAERPVLGVGPDNFRHHYGRYLGLGTWDVRVHANNTYLEILTGAGVPGLLAMLWLAAAAGRLMWRRLQDAHPAAHGAAAIAIVLAVVIGGHALVDSFLAFTTTYVMFAIAGGLALSPGLVAEPTVHAHRV